MNYDKLKEELTLDDLKEMAKKNPQAEQTIMNEIGAWED